MEKKNIFQYFISCITKDYANFNGRARRMEYWGFMVVYLILYYCFSYFSIGNTFISIISIILYFVLWIPSLAVAVRRMHDVGKSGWYILIPFYNLILVLTEGDHGPNQYGPDPKNPYLGDELDEIGMESQEN